MELEAYGFIHIEGQKAKYQINLLVMVQATQVQRGYCTSKNIYI
jgi:hypothetical protein